MCKPSVKTTRSVQHVSRCLNLCWITSTVTATLAFQTAPQQSDHISLRHMPPTGLSALPASQLDASPPCRTSYRLVTTPAPPHGSICRLTVAVANMLTGRRSFGGVVITSMTRKSLAQDMLLLAGCSAAGAAISATMSMICCAGSSPSVRSAGLLLSCGMNTMVGRPSICKHQRASERWCDEDGREVCVEVSFNRCSKATSYVKFRLQILMKCGWRRGSMSMFSGISSPE
eukprot:366338-Chlamydomonas_euryale.AAC.1